MKILLTLVVALSLTGCGDLKKEIRRLQTERDAMQAEIDYLKQQLYALESSLTVTILTMQILAENEAEHETEIALLQDQATTLLEQYAALSGYPQIIEIVDPCENGPGFDEVLLKTTLGYVAYFEQGNKRFLSLLSDGSYVTTDQQGCNFKIINGVFND